MQRMCVLASLGIMCIMWAAMAVRGQHPDASTVSPATSDLVVAPGDTPSGATASVENYPCIPTKKTCVCEMKQTTRKVYACKCEEYCLPHCSLLSMLFGRCSCDDGQCGDLKVRHRLIVKTVDAGEKKQCVVREVPTCPSTAPTPAVLTCPRQR
jgi:hypothetical protein